MADAPEIASLRKKVAELEQQLAEERESFEWDLKAAKEASEATVKKLEQQLAEMQKKEKSGKAEKPPASDMDLLQRRAMLAEKKVAELQAELQRTLTAKMDKPASGDSFLRQRAEQAEKEREDLRREKRALERKLEEMENQARLKQQELEKAQASRAEADKLRDELAGKERELKKLERSWQESAAEGGEAKTLREKLDRAEKEAREKDGRLRQLEEQAKFAETSRQQAERRAEEQANKASQLETEINRLKLASGQMIEQRERESMRLQADLREAEDQRTQAGQNIVQARQEIERLKRDLEAITRERERMKSELAHLRESRVTKVTPPAPADPFEEKTVKTSQPAGATISTVRDGRLLGAQAEPEPPPPVAEEPYPPPVGERQAALEEEVIVGELVEEKSETTPLELDQPEAPPAAAATDRKFGRSGTEIVRGRDLPPENERLPMAASRRVSESRSGRRWLTPVLVLAGAGGLIVLAWLKFPAWFGTQEIESVSADAGMADGSAGSADRIEVAVALPVPDAGEQAGAAEPDGGVTTPDEEEVSEAPLEGEKEMEQAFQELRNLLGKKRYPEALKAAAKLVEAHPESAMAHHLYGRALFYRDDLRRSLEELRRSLKLDASLRDSHYEIIGVCLRSKDKACACQAAQQFIKGSPPKDKRADMVKRSLKKWGCR